MHEKEEHGSLTAREREMSHLVVDGKTTKEVARALEISPKAEENHGTRLTEKLDVPNTTKLVRYAARRGLLPEEPRRYPPFLE